ncbi:hypothetical protein [Bacteroides cellulosilyticus]|jgi:hypothetical protein|uniref:hypothetical protein n=1 Tax=Bacteroides cellulosilyticus TaxID=246787 RepID=UPI0018ACC355|nr:hypothetical protein [Bacteroides cellulosilyticus]
MLYYNFCGYEGFKALFGLEKRDNGVAVRKNKILLGHLKNPALLSYCREHGDYTLLHIYNMADLQKKVMEAVIESGENDEKLPYEVELIGKIYYSSKYQTDEAKGLCEDLDKSSVRYINVERNRIFKMRSGKFMREIILETKIGKLLSPSVINWISGDVFTQQWAIYTHGNSPDIELHVNDEFWRIYGSKHCKGNFDSCMVDEDRTSFYHDSVKAKAAYITDKTGLVVARSILFTDVTDQDGKKWRLLERQYSSESDDVLKRLLVDKLIQEDYIDGYKVVGASCHQANSFVDVYGNSLSDRKFEIDCDLELEDTLSYQDSFKWYSYNLNKAYNYENSSFSYNLDTTDFNLYGDNEEDDGEWDDYHQYYCNNTRPCYRNGREIWVDSENLDDFVWIESKEEYHHENDCVCCNECQTDILLDDAIYSEVTEEYYCCEECMEEAEDEFKRKNWYYSEYDNEWHENLDDITRINIWNESEGVYEEKSICTDTLDKLIENKDVWQFDEDVFDKVNPSTNLPYDYKLKKEINHEYAIIEEAV